MIPGSSEGLVRYTANERTNHWFVAFAFVLAALSGLALFHPALFWLSNLFGGGTWTRMLHPIIGLVMLLAFVSWPTVLEIQPDAGRRLGMAATAAKDVMNNREERLPEVGRYNAGQKLLFYVLVFCMLGLLLSGLVIWREFFSLYFSARRRPPRFGGACGVRIPTDLRDHRARLCCDLGEGLDAGDDAGRCEPRLGLEASSGLVPRDDPCSEFSNPVRLKPSRSDPFHGFACPTGRTCLRNAPNA